MTLHYNKMNDQLRVESTKPQYNLKKLNKSFVRKMDKLFNVKYQNL